MNVTGLSTIIWPEYRRIRRSSQVRGSILETHHVKNRRPLGSTLPGVGVEITLEGMSTLSEVEAVVPQFSARELAELERFVRQARLTKEKGSGRSALDLPPLDLGQMLKPLGTREEWYDEMLEDRA